MNICYFDCVSGVAGDMLLGGLIDAGWPADELAQAVAALALPGVSVSAERVKRKGIAATHVRVALDDSAPRKHRHLSHILRIIDAADLPPRVKERSAAIFRRLAEAEAAVHNSTVEKVHFHEVGADDAIVDIVGVCAGLEHFDIARFSCSAVPVGSGTVQCDHGLMPVPAPATAMLLRSATLAACDEPGELTTPTGAAIVTTLADFFGPPPGMRLVSVGVGAGTREGQARPNITRILLGEVADAPAPRDGDEVVELEAELDDATGQQLAFAMDRLFEAGALDVFITPVLMKKGRPGHLVTVLARPESGEMLSDIMLLETPTFGVRRYACARSVLRREHVTMATEFGPIRIKLGYRGERLVHAAPEYEDCRAAAAAAARSLDDVRQAALHAHRQHVQPGGAGSARTPTA